ncbi:MAG: MarR family transcriptional regulator [Chloroflexota bacterium]
MDTLAVGGLLRDMARLHVQIQREGVSQCASTTSTQCAILTELGRSGAMTLADLGRRVGLDKGWISRTVEGLAAEGLIHKVQSETDRRTIHVALSSTGEDRCETLNHILNAQAERVISHIPPEDRDCVFHALQLLQAALHNERLDPQEILETASVKDGAA